MIVYVESNFVLEIALGQEQSTAAERILDLVADGHVTLVIPTFGLSEPFSRVRQRGRDRQSLRNEMDRVEDDLRRADHGRDIAEQMRPLGEAVVSLEDIELTRLQSTVGRVLHVAETVELSAPLFEAAEQHVFEQGLDLEDAIIFACVTQDLRQRPVELPKCFTSRDSTAFFQPVVADELERHNCRYIARFEQAVDFVLSRI